METKEALEDLQYFTDEYQVAITYYELLLELSEALKDSSFRSRNLHFSSFALRAFSSSMTFCLARFFDTDPRSRSFSDLLNTVGNPTILESYSELKEVWTTSPTYAPFRNMYLAHLDRRITKSTLNDVVALTSPTTTLLTGEELKNFFNEIHILLSEIRRHYEPRASHRWAPYPARQEFKNILGSFS